MDTMNKAKHSPLPWRLIETNSDYADPSADSHFLIEADNEVGIALTIHDCVPYERGNAELIVTAVNERERLREALRNLLSAAVETVEENKPTVRLRVMIAEANKMLFLNGINVLNDEKGK